MAPLTKEELNTKIDELFPDGIPNNISPAKLREILVDIILSYSTLNLDDIGELFLALSGGTVSGEVQVLSNADYEIQYPGQLSVVSDETSISGEAGTVGVFGRSRNGTGIYGSSKFGIGGHFESDEGPASEFAGPIAIKIKSGTIELPSGEIGKSEQLFFHSSTSGDVKSLTFENGILIDFELRV